MSKKRKASSVNDLRPVEQTMVLETLAARNDAVGEAVREEIERLLPAVDPESVAGEVQIDLEFIDLDTIEARAGDDRYGYTPPDEAAWQVLEETLEPYLARMEWYHSAGRDEACDAYALGVLRGLFDFHHDSEAEWKELVPDDVREMFGSVLREWQRRRKGAAERDAMRDRLATWCPGWERDVT
jgi:hypothetical protein